MVIQFMILRFTKIIFQQKIQHLRFEKMNKTCFLFKCFSLIYIYIYMFLTFVLSIALPPSNPVCEPHGLCQGAWRPRRRSPRPRTTPTGTTPGTRRRRLRIGWVRLWMDSCDAVNLRTFKLIKTSNPQVIYKLN